MIAALYVECVECGVTFTTTIHEQKCCSECNKQPPNKPGRQEMMMDSDVGGLGRDMLDLLLECPQHRSFVASELSWSRPGPTGSALSKLADRGLLIGASDPEKWGRRRYVLSPAGNAMAMEARTHR